MRFSCDSCQARYAVADEKLRGRSLHVSCPRCGHAIVLTPGPAPDELDASELLPDEPDTGTSRGREWYFLASGVEVGPLDLPALQARADSGDVSASTYVWRDGQPDWIRLKDLPELADVLARLPGGDTDDQAEAAFLAAVRSDEERLRAAGSSEALSGADEPPTLDALAEELRLGLGAGGEDSTRTSPPPDPFAAVPDAPDFEPPAPGETTNAILQAAGAKSRNVGRVVATLVLVGVVGAGAAYLALAGDDRTPAVPEPAEVVDSDKDAPAADWTRVNELDSAQLDILTGGANRKTAEEDASPREAERRRPGSVRNARKGDAELAALVPRDVDDAGAIKTVRRAQPDLELTPEQLAAMARINAEARPRGGVAPRPLVKDDAVDAPRMAGDGLDPQVVARKIAEVQPGIENCIASALRREPNLRLGKVVITATILPSGPVQKAVFDKPSVADTDLGACLRRVIKGIVFPAFSGGPQDVEIPFVLGASG